MRGGWKAFEMQPIGELYLQCGLIFYKNGMVPFCNIILVDDSQKAPFLALKKWKMDFRPTKMKTPFVNIVCHSKIHMCA